MNSQRLAHTIRNWLRYELEAFLRDARGRIYLDRAQDCQHLRICVSLQAISGSSLQSSCLIFFTALQGEGGKRDGNHTITLCQMGRGRTYKATSAPLELLPQHIKVKFHQIQGNLPKKLVRS